MWLGLPHDAFFVNLKPNEPERVLHPQISATVVGRVLLVRCRPPQLPPAAPSCPHAHAGTAHTTHTTDALTKAPTHTQSLSLSRGVRAPQEADFFLKNVTSFLLHPDTESGHIFWESVYEPPPAATCVSFRQWIVPLQSTVVESDEHVCVQDTVPSRAVYCRRASLPLLASSTHRRCVRPCSLARAGTWSRRHWT